MALRLDGPIAEAIRGTRIYKIVDTCNAALCFYQFLLTLGDEVDLMWSTSTGAIGELLFYASRYWLLSDTVLELTFAFGHLTGAQCKIVSIYLSFSGAVGMTLSQGILILRTRALWQNSRVILRLFAAAGVVILCASIFTSRQWALKSRFIASRTVSLNLNGCAVVAPYRLVYVFWILTISIDLLLLSLTLVSYVRDRRSGSLIGALTAGLYRDAFTYLGLMFVVAVASLAANVFVSEYFDILLYGTERVLYTISACRVVLNLRGAATRGSMLDIDSKEFSSSRERTDGESGHAIARAQGATLEMRRSATVCSGLWLGRG